MKIYIAGKIAGENIELCKLKFALVEEELKKLGSIPINPFKLGCRDTWTFDQCKPFNFKAIAQCNAIYMLNDYESSPGAKAELQKANSLKLQIFYQAANDHFQIIEQLGSAV